MTVDEKKAFDNLVERVIKLENSNMIYNYIDVNMPTWAKPTIVKLVEKGFLSGTEEGLGLTMDFMRLLVILDRANLFE